jgi:PAS domain S-box-containing protein
VTPDRNSLPLSARWPLWAQYILAIVTVLVALGARWLLDPLLGMTVPFITVFAALLLLVLCVRAGPFLAAAAVGLIGTLLLFIRPRFIPAIGSTTGMLQVGLFSLAVGAAAIAAWLSQRAQNRHRRVEEDLLRRNQELQLVTDAAPALISYVDADLRYQLVNARYLDWFARAPEEIVGHHMWQVLGDAAFELVKPHAQAALAGQRSRFESEVPYRTGTRHVHAEYVPNVRTDGTVAGFYVLVTDISELKQVEAVLKETDRRKDEFLATLAHELRNPLAAIRSATELLGNVESPQLLERVTVIIKRQVALMVRLIDDLLDVSRITHGTLELRVERIRLNTLLESALEGARSWIERKQHRVEIDAPDDTVELQGDPVRLVQVFTNMLSNACKYTAPGGRIRIRVARDGDDAVVEVHDSGIGISPDKLGVVFDMFSQLEQPNHRNEGGLGIGLALSRRLVELHGGSMSAASDGPGRGSRFTVRLPALPPERVSMAGKESRLPT